MKDPLDPSNPYIQPPQELAFTPEEPPRQGRGCFFYGCLIAVVLFVLGLICAGVLVYMAKSFLDNLIKEYAATAPLVLPKADFSEDDRKALMDRWEKFKTAADNDQPAEMTLTADELNSLIEGEADFKGKVYVTIKDDKITGQISLPLDFLPFGMGKGRFLNGSTTLTVLLVQGELIVHLQDVEVDGKKPPASFMDQLRHENFAKDFAKDPSNRAALERFSSIEVKDGKMVMKSRATAASAVEKASPKELEKPAEDQPKTKDDTPATKEDEAKKAPDDAPKTKDDAPPAKEDDAKKAPEPAKADPAEVKAAA